MLLSVLVWSISSSAFVVTEITIPEVTYDYCKKLNKVVLIEGISHILLCIILFAARYIWFGALLIPVGIWHIMRHMLFGAPFTATEIHRPRFRETTTTLYSGKLILYAVVFLCAMVNTGILVVNIFFSGKDVMTY
jgi:hypothetical protein